MPTLATSRPSRRRVVRRPVNLSHPFGTRHAVPSLGSSRKTATPAGSRACTTGRAPPRRAPDPACRSHGGNHPRHGRCRRAPPVHPGDRPRHERSMTLRSGAPAGPAGPTGRYGFRHVPAGPSVARSWQRHRFFRPPRRGAVRAASHPARRRPQMIVAGCLRSLTPAHDLRRGRGAGTLAGGFREHPHRPSRLAHPRFEGGGRGTGTPIGTRARYSAAFRTAGRSGRDQGDRQTLEEALQTVGEARVDAGEDGRRGRRDFLRLPCSATRPY